MEETILNFGSQELQNEIKDTSNYAKFDLNKPEIIEVLNSQVKPRVANFDGKDVTRYDINIKLSGEEKTWSVSKTTLRIISDNWDKTKKFNVMRQEKSYSVIPLED